MKIQIGLWKTLDSISTKELQIILKNVLNKVTAEIFNKKLGTASYDPEQIVKFRGQCKNIKWRHIYFRLISKDFYTKEKM